MTSKFRVFTPLCDPAHKVLYYRYLTGLRMCNIYNVRCNDSLDKCNDHIYLIDLPVMKYLQGLIFSELFINASGFVYI